MKSPRTPSPESRRPSRNGSSSSRTWRRRRPCRSPPGRPGSPTGRRARRSRPGWTVREEEVLAAPYDRRRAQPIPSTKTKYDQNGVVDPAELDLGHGRSSGEWAGNGSGRRMPAYVRHLGPATQGPLASGHQPPYLDPGPLVTASPSHRFQESRMRRFFGCTALGLAAALALTASPLAAQVRVASPDGRNEVTVEIREGRLTYGHDPRPRAPGPAFRTRLPAPRGTARCATVSGSPTARASRMTSGGRSPGARSGEDHYNELAVAVEETGRPVGGSPCACALRRRHRLPLRAARAAGAG